jgi:drug/metabolite transporter (DMT)-like permease
MKASSRCSFLWALPLYIVTNFCLGYLSQQEGLRLLKAWEMAAILQTVPLFSTLFALLLLHDTMTIVEDWPRRQDFGLYRTHPVG